MAKKTKKRITINAFEKALEHGVPETITIEWNGLEVDIKPVLSLGEMYGFVNGVVSVCVNQETGAYNAEVKDFAIKMMVLENYANFTLPKNSERAYELIYRTDAYLKVEEHINPIQFKEIREAIDVKIEHILKSNVEAVNKQINEMLSSMGNIQEQFSSLLGDVDGEDIKGLIGAITNGKIDEGKLMKAYLEEKQPRLERPKIIPASTE